MKLLNTIVMLALIIATPLSPVAAGPAAADDGVAVRIDRADLAGRSLPAAVRRVDYEHFVWLELGAAGLAELVAAGLRYQPAPDFATISLPGHRFDTRLGEPALPAELMADYVADGRLGLYLVQLVAPARADWLAELAAVGVEPLQYTPYNAFLAYVDGAGAEAARQLDFVRWVGAHHPAYRIDPDLSGRLGRIENVAIFLADPGGAALDASLTAIAGLGGQVVQHFAAGGPFVTVIAALDAGRLNNVARLPGVVWLGYSSPQPGLDDEMSDQIVVGNYDELGQPFTGYQSWLAGKGVDGSDVRLAIVDTGIDYDHPDFQGRIVAGVSYNGATPPGNDTTGGHGTHCAGIAGGAANTGIPDDQGFLWGLGVAPGVGLVAQNALMSSSWPPAGGWQAITRDSVLNGAVASSNSWYTGASGSQGYSDAARMHDIIVRDANLETSSVAEPLIMVFSAGNSGSGAMTITEPKEAKNLIVVGSSLNKRAGNIDDISGFSSRGPAQDGRLLPNVAAPGQTISSARNDGGGSCTTSPVPGPGAQYYSFCSGTSMAAPHVAGGVALIAQWWRTFNGGADPSPALAKALLINGAEDMGTADIPNNDEGWGRMNLDNVIDNGQAMLYFDQETLFTETGQAWQFYVEPADPSKPLKATLVWSDAPAMPGANPALVNDLDLRIDTDDATYYGNNFAGGWSTPDGGPDGLNNIEGIHIQNPTAPEYLLTVSAANVAGNAVPYNADSTDQDWALVIYNGRTGQPDFRFANVTAGNRACVEQEAGYAVAVAPRFGFQGSVELAAAGLPADVTASFAPGSVTPPATSLLTLAVGADAPGGLHTFAVVGQSGDLTHQISAQLEVVAAAPAAPTLNSPADGAVDVARQPALSWMASPGAESYRVQLALDAGFSLVVHDQGGIVETSYTLPQGLFAGTTYYWRTAAENICGPGVWSPARRFTTKALACVLLVDDDSNSPDVSGYFASALDELDLSYDYFQVAGLTAAGPGIDYLRGYPAVVWSSGDRRGTLSAPAAGPGAADEANLALYLQDGGRLLLDSQDYLHDRGGSAFAGEYLGVASYDSDGNNASRIVGNNSDPIGQGFGIVNLSYPIGFAREGDEVNPTASASMAFRSGLSVEGAVLDKASEDWKTVFFATSWTPVVHSDADVGRSLLGRVLDWFWGAAGCQVVYWADENADCRVDVADVMAVSGHWNTAAGEPGYSFTLDEDGNGVIDLWDVALVAAQWGWTCS